MYRILQCEQTTDDSDCINFRLKRAGVGLKQKARLFACQWLATSVMFQLFTKRAMSVKPKSDQEKLSDADHQKLKFGGLKYSPPSWV